jgi:hypothetical protein
VFCETWLWCILCIGSTGVGGRAMTEECAHEGCGKDYQSAGDERQRGMNEYVATACIDS